jgi:hypothetical protein
MNEAYVVPCFWEAKTNKWLSLALKNKNETRFVSLFYDYKILSNFFQYALIEFYVNNPIPVRGNP